MLEWPNLEDQIFGKLIVVDRAGTNKHNCRTWHCLCECGNFREVASNALTSGRTKACVECSRRKAKDISGEKFGRLTVLHSKWDPNIRKTVWVCECECGNLTTVRSVSLKNGNTKSCGCLKREASRRTMHSVRDRGLAYDQRHGSYFDATGNRRPEKTRKKDKSASGRPDIR